MSKTGSPATRFEEWAVATGIDPDEVALAWKELARLGLAAMDEREVTVSVGAAAGSY